MVTCIGLMIEDNKVFVPNKGNDIFSSFNKKDDKILFIRNIKGEPVKKVRFGYLYNNVDIEADPPIELFTEGTIKTLFDLGLISNEYDLDHPICKDWLLSNLIQNEYALPNEVYDTVYNTDTKMYGNKDSLSGWLGLAATIEAAKFLVSKGATVRTVSGYGDPLSWQEMHERKELVEYLKNIKK